MVCLFEKNNSVGRIILNRVEASNSISVELVRELDKILRNVKTDSTLRTLTFEGAGAKVFSAGADLKERIKMSREEVLKFLDSFRDLCFLIESISIPTIALLNGDAYGGGLELALCCDLRYISDQAKIGLTETKLGIIPGAGGTQRLPRLIGMSRAKELIFSARKISSEEALRFGIVNEVFPQENFFKNIGERISEIVSSAPIAVRQAKKSIEEGFYQSLETGISIERENYLRTLDSKDRNEALLAFQEKRQPQFTGE
jgi:methylglutaconyl-CoA hydratase